MNASRFCIRLSARWLALALAATAAPAVLGGCKPSVEGETRAWDQNKLTLQEWSGRFPNFRPAIDGRVAEAQADFDAAKGIGDADARAAKMREANDKLYALTSAFQEIDRKLKEYDTLKADPNLLRLPGTILMPAMQMSDGLLRQARGRMEGQVANAGEALGRLRDASAGVTRAMAPLQDARNRAAAAAGPQPGQPGGPPMPVGAPPPGAPMPGQMGQPGQPGMGMGAAPGLQRPGQMPGAPGAPGGMANPAMANPQMGAGAMPRPGMPGGMAGPAGNPAMPPPGMAPGMAPAMGAPGMGPRPGAAGAAPGMAPAAGAPPAGAAPGAPPAGAKPF